MRGIPNSYAGHRPLLSAKPVYQAESFRGIGIVILQSPAQILPVHTENLVRVEFVDVVYSHC